jgi:sugar phosphate isomerase/epimerase
MLGAALLGPAAKLRGGNPAPADVTPRGHFVLCFNTATIRGQKVGIAKEIEIAAQAGFQAIEPWVEAIETYAKAGGKLEDLRRRITNAGLTIEGAIAFPEWVVDDPARRARGLEAAKRQMDLVAQLGGQRIAAPPAGATNEPGLDLLKAADRYRALLELGDQMGVWPMLEVWGFSQNLNRLSHCAHVAIESGHPKAAALADMFHLYRAGSPWHGLRLLGAAALPVFHMNDYPAEPPREWINNSFRIMPGDGVAPTAQVLAALLTKGSRVVLSLELFSPRFWELDPVEVAQTGYRKGGGGVTVRCRSSSEGGDLDAVGFELSLGEAPCPCLTLIQQLAAQAIKHRLVRLPLVDSGQEQHRAELRVVRRLRRCGAAGLDGIDQDVGIQKDISAHPSPRASVCVQPGNAPCVSTAPP